MGSYYGYIIYLLLHTITRNENRHWTNPSSWIIFTKYWTWLVFLLPNDSDNFCSFVVYIGISSTSNLTKVVINVRENWASEGNHRWNYLHVLFLEKNKSVSPMKLSLCMFPRKYFIFVPILILKTKTINTLILDMNS